MSNIETMLQEKRVFPPPADLVKQANIPGMEAYQRMVAEAERDFEGFWGRLARETLLWSKPFTKVLDESKEPMSRSAMNSDAARSGRSEPASTNVG